MHARMGGYGMAAHKQVAGGDVGRGTKATAEGFVPQPPQSIVDFKFVSPPGSPDSSTRRPLRP